MNINEMFVSINGEVTGAFQGSLCTFIRTQGCNCKCSYCDTPQSQDSEYFAFLPVDKIVEQVICYKNKNVMITGGEPLLQMEELKKLCSILIGKGFFVSIETNGSVVLPTDSKRASAEETLWNYVNWIVDYKTPSSGMEQHMIVSNFLDYDFGSNDFIKFVIGSELDFRKAKWLIRQIYNPYVKFAFSPIHGCLDVSTLFDWMQRETILRERGAILNLQLHKILKLK